MIDAPRLYHLQPPRAESDRPSTRGCDPQSAHSDALRRYRLKRASASGVPPYVVASDRTLREIAAQRPRTKDELLVIHGIGPARARRYGKGLLEVVAESAN